MFDNIKTNVGFDAYWKYISVKFDLPIAEIIDKRHHGVLYFSKISATVMEIDYKNKEISYLLEPEEIMYTDLYEDKSWLVWKRRKKSQENIYECKGAIMRWMDRERVDFYSVIDYGPLSIIYKEKSQILKFEELKMYIDTSDKVVKRSNHMLKYDDLKDLNKRVRIIRKMLPKNKKEAIKGIYRQIKKIKYKHEN
ncbi:MAG: hypothetical protein N3G74_02355 [Candidatus Micrarchaeota archaeon]|nr:hypothetical protein [Candidatus Micrarchaeota archaeon]